MAASYPGSIKTFTTKASGEAIASSHINDLQNEVVAVETQLGINAGAMRSFSPVITASATNPTLGNGSLLGHYTTIGKLVIAEIYWWFGTTTDKGSGTYYFSLPVTPAAAQTNYPFGTWASYSGSSHYSGSLRYASSTTVQGAVDGAIYLSSGSPYSPVSGSRYFIQLIYFAA